MNEPSAIQLALNKLHEAMEGMAKDAKGWKVSDISALNGVTKEIVSIKKELAESQQELADLKASLPKVRADAFEAGAEWCETRISSYRISQAADIYADKLEAGNE